MRGAICKYRRNVNMVFYLAGNKNASMFSIILISISSFLVSDTHAYSREKKKLVFTAKLDPLSVRFTYGRVNGASVGIGGALHTIHRQVERVLTETFQKEAYRMGVGWKSNSISVLVMYDPLYCSAYIARNEDFELCEATYGYCCELVNGVVISIASRKATASIRVPTEYREATVIVKVTIIRFG
ncbi:unnamed protein product [Cylicocyclus nassatus]|uniref:Uncharacterized protein n=1 Tax=Cylicocyclus nassatus TaxID=53992 RepID=A0AA36DVW9_CYLNA|nr:unnamed protein product [Cylicocyclus nassatus]